MPVAITPTLVEIEDPRVSDEHWDDAILQAAATMEDDGEFPRPPGFRQRGVAKESVRVPRAGGETAFPHGHSLDEIVRELSRRNPKYQFSYFEIGNESQQVAGLFGLLYRALTARKHDNRWRRAEMEPETDSIPIGSDATEPEIKGLLTTLAMIALVLNKKLSQKPELNVETQPPSDFDRDVKAQAARRATDGFWRSFRSVAQCVKRRHFLAQLTFDDDLRVQVRRAVWLKKVEVRAPGHLAFDELAFGDLRFDLAV